MYALIIVFIIVLLLGGVLVGVIDIGQNTNVTQEPLQWSNMPDWYVAGSMPELNTTTPTDEEQAKKMCEDITMCKGISRKSNAQKWMLHAYLSTGPNLPVPLWNPGAMTLVNNRDTKHYNKNSYAAPPRPYKEMPGVIVPDRQSPIITFSGEGRDFNFAKNVCDAYPRNQGTRCSAITQDDKGNYSLWDDIVFGVRLDPTRKSWLAPVSQSFKTGKYLKYMTSAETTQYMKDKQAGKPVSMYL